ncbi:alpha/beta hydrolase [Phycicoccus sp. CSK15P-2]|uniref:alpha/beta hydrolase n=1 Tax=Phycicoccus sp. CSK15P-2 TaxID=2807627 RepID=UPI001950EEF7|nr:alpha/beta hydrolase [Phycicoccus sp. CSK15P-2]MBM6402799.1 alpha/beta hydrolase [Phycicoccus sp. CSK15P-2]
MQSTTTTVTVADGTEIFTHRWLPDGEAKAVLVVAHGMAEHSARYARLAETLTAAGYAVYAHDHRGHGRTASAADHGYLADHDGWATITADLRTVVAHASSEHTGLPVFLLGHSMGSILARTLVIGGSSELAGLVLTGPTSHTEALTRAGAGIAATEARLRGGRHTSALMDKLSFGQYNAAFKPNRTDFDWLSRDDAEVDAYVADPLCGNTFTSGFFSDLMGGLLLVNDRHKVAGVRRDLPVLVLAGDQDPVGAGGKGPRQVTEQYREAGLTDVTLTLYPGARHEIFNETIRDEVTADLVRWLDAHLPG